MYFKVSPKKYPAVLFMYNITGAELAQFVMGKAVNKEVPGSNPTTNYQKNNRPVLLDKALYLRIFEDNNH